MTNAEKYLITQEEYEIILALRELQSDVKELKESGELFYDKTSNLIMNYLNRACKPTLTEDEKVILKHINGINIDRIGRHECGDLILLFRTGGFWLMTTNFNVDNLFQFIKPRRRI